GSLLGRDRAGAGKNCRGDLATAWLQKCAPQDERWLQGLAGSSPFRRHHRDLRAGQSSAAADRSAEGGRAHGDPGGRSVCSAALSVGKEKWAAEAKRYLAGSFRAHVQAADQLTDHHGPRSLARRPLTDKKVGGPTIFCSSKAALLATNEFPETAAPAFNAHSRRMAAVVSVASCDRFPGKFVGSLGQPVGGAERLLQRLPRQVHRRAASGKRGILRASSVGRAADKAKG